jgi:hypothetical protein
LVSNEPQGSANQTDWGQVSAAVVKAFEARHRAKDEIGIVIHQPWGAAASIAGGDEAGKYVSIFVPGLRGLRRRWATAAARSVRWANIPLMPKSLTTGEFAWFALWAAAVVAAVWAAPVPFAARVTFGVLGVLVAFPVAVFPAQWFRKHASQWSRDIMQLNWDGPLRQLVDEMQAPPRPLTVQLAFHQRLYDLACFCPTYPDKEDPVAAFVVEEAVSLLKRARSGVQSLSPRDQIPLDTLYASTRETREQSAAKTLLTIRDIVMGRDVARKTSTEGTWRLFGDILQGLDGVERSHTSAIEQIRWLLQSTTDDG